MNQEQEQTFLIKAQEQANVKNKSLSFDLNCRNVQRTEIVRVTMVTTLLCLSLPAE